MNLELYIQNKAHALHYSNIKFQFFHPVTHKSLDRAPADYIKKRGENQLTFVMQRLHKIQCFFLRKGTGKVCTTKILKQNKTDEDIFPTFLIANFLFTEHTTWRVGDAENRSTEHTRTQDRTRTLQLARIANRHARLPLPRPSRRRRRGAQRLPPPLPHTGQDPVPPLDPAPSLAEARRRVLLQSRRRRGPNRGIAARGPRAGLGRPALPLLRAPPRRARRLPAEPLPLPR